MKMDPEKYLFELYILLPSNIKQYVKFTNKKKVKELVKKHKCDEKFKEIQRKKKEE